eukprot:8384638-Karenia_brevis.AAC.1
MPPRPSVWIAPEDREEFVKGILESNVMELIPESKVPVVQGSLLLHGLIGVAKRGRPLTNGGKPIMRLVMNLAGTNVLFEPIQGDIHMLPSSGQWQSIFVDYGEEIRWSASDL